MPNRWVTGVVGEMIFGCYHPTRLQQGLNITHFLAASHTGLGALDQEAADSYSAAAAIVYKPALGSDALFWGVSVRLLQTPLPLPATSVLGQGAGTRGSPSLPTQVSGLVKLKTALAGRANRGRMFIPFPPTGAQSASEPPTALYQADLASLAGFVIGTQTIGSVPNQTTIQMWIVKRKPVTLRAAVTGIAVRPLWATQRRRGDEGKPNPPPWS